jgi:hypothetical protein
MVWPALQGLGPVEQNASELSYLRLVTPGVAGRRMVTISDLETRCSERAVNIATSLDPFGRSCLARTRPNAARDSACRGRRRIDYVEDRKGHDRCYSVDYSKIATLGYARQIGFEMAGVDRLVVPRQLRLVGTESGPTSWPTRQQTQGRRGRV